MPTTAARRMSLAEFLALEETKPYLELIDGEVLEKAMPGPYHSATVTRMISRLGPYLERHPEGRLDTELRHVRPDEERAYLPDISVIRKGRFPKDLGARGPVEVQPDLAIEVLSPDDRASRVLERVDFYMRSGTELLWVIDPELETVTVYRRGAPTEVLRPPGALDGAPVLSEFSLPLADLFAAKEVV